MLARVAGLEQLVVRVVVVGRIDQLALEEPCIASTLRGRDSRQVARVREHHALEPTDLPGWVASHQLSDAIADVLVHATRVANLRQAAKQAGREPAARGAVAEVAAGLDLIGEGAR